jgi:hypothetical protein
MGRVPRADTSRLVVSGSLPTDLRSVVAVMGARAALLRVHPAAAPIDVAFVFDSVSAIRGRPMSRSIHNVTHVLPPAGGGRCLVIEQLHSGFGRWSARGSSRYLTSVATAARMLGPCAFYEAFGTPGMEIDRWLANGAWKFGESGSVRGRSAPLQFDNYSWAPLWGRTGGWLLRRYFTLLGYRCASGDRDVCRQVVLDPYSDRESGVGLRAGTDRIIARTTVDGGWWEVSLGPLEPAFLSEMANSIGADQFRRFWTSDKPTGEAFFAATGQDIGAWTAAWAGDAYGHPRRGPGMDTSSTSWAALLALLGLSGAIVSARRRQVA